VTASDTVDRVPSIRLVSVTSNEPDDGLGDGDTTNDIVLVDERTFKLRAERSGIGTGRVYTLTYEAEDTAGNRALGSAQVSVPLSRAATR